MRVRDLIKLLLIKSETLDEEVYISTDSEGCDFRQLDDLEAMILSNGKVLSRGPLTEGLVDLGYIDKDVTTDGDEIITLYPRDL